MRTRYGIMSGVKRMQTKTCAIAIVFAVAVCGVAAGREPYQPGIGSHDVRYATDAFPGFDSESELLGPEKKEPRLFGWIYGPEKEDAAAQLAWCRECVSNESWRAARLGFDALVREWPTSPEAPLAQKELADLYADHYHESENAFREYNYLLDFYSSQCDYAAIAARAYAMAEAMRKEGKRVFFVPFANTVDVRRAYEAVVLRAPGAPFTPRAMLTVGSLREDEGRDDLAVSVYENLRNLHPTTPEAIRSLHHEARALMKLLRDYGYNRERCKATVDFLRFTLANHRDFEGRDEVAEWLAEAQETLEGEAFAAARFYDSPTRTRQSAIDAYEAFVRDYPASVHAEKARARLAELKGEPK